MKNESAVSSIVRDQDNPFEPLLHDSVSSPEQYPGSKSLYSARIFSALLSLNIVSIACSLFCIVLLTCLRYQKGRIRRWRTQHVSIRLILYASVIDVGYTCFRIYDIIIAQSDTQPNSQANCQAAMFGVTFFALMSVFVRALFSVHLHAVVVHRAKKPLNYERRFIMFCFSLALVLALLPLTRFSYTWVDYDPTLGSGHCSYFSLESVPRHTTTVDFTAEEARRAVVAGLLYCWMTYFGWVALTIGYCMLVIGAVIYRLWIERRRTIRLIAQRTQQLLTHSEQPNSQELHETNASRSEQGPPAPMLVFVRCLEKIELWKVAKKVLRRVAQFPAAIILCHALEVAWATATLTRIIPIFKTGAVGSSSDLKHLYISMQIMLAFQGIITLLSLFLEPSVKQLVVEWWNYWHFQRDNSKKMETSASSDNRGASSNNSDRNNIRSNGSSIRSSDNSGNGQYSTRNPVSALETQNHTLRTAHSFETMPWDVVVLNPEPRQAS
ncbi:hypothetical protein J3B02_002194 [Coemansia erecta]|uniref:Uncharacterized protein n=1 Tax=Coemansia asiatica TaxID=1052880 RepID=A0A9W8CJI7_9FUNG|nr:hypothetical protein LPJ64_002602 [Coemansia asiatica]KAJ2855395.1 hypothetical protein J3B02_002194 [Coemansia erecta]